MTVLEYTWPHCCTSSFLNLPNLTILEYSIPCLSWIYLTLPCLFYHYLSGSYLVSFTIYGKFYGSYRTLPCLVYHSPFWKLTDHALFVLLSRNATVICIIVCDGLIQHGLVRRYYVMCKIGSRMSPHSCCIYQLRKSIWCLAEQLGLCCDCSSVSFQSLSWFYWFL